MMQMVEKLWIGLCDIFGFTYVYIEIYVLIYLERMKGRRLFEDPRDYDGLFKKSIREFDLCCSSWRSQTKTVTAERMEQVGWILRRR